MNLEDIEKTSKELIDFERSMALLFTEGKIKGASHFSRGNEEQLIKIFRGLREGDYIFHSQIRNGGYTGEHSEEKKLIEIPGELVATENHPVFRGVGGEDFLFLSYRNHPHCLLKGVPEECLRQEIINGNSMTPISSKYKIMASGIVAGQLPPALWAAFGIKLKSLDSHVWAFCGDMAAETGIFHECAKYSHQQDLPITFVVEDNGWSVDTPTKRVWGGQNDFLMPNTIRYRYESKVPHQGVGKEVGF